MPHIAMKQVVTAYNNDGYGDVTCVSKTITKPGPCCFKVCHMPANCYMGFHNLGSDLLLGPASDECDLSTRNQSKGIWCTKDRLNDDENPHWVGIAPTKPGICLRKPIQAKRHTLRQLACELLPECPIALAPWLDAGCTAKSGHLIIRMMVLRK